MLPGARGVRRAIMRNARTSAPPSIQVLYRM